MYGSIIQYMLRIDCDTRLRMESATKWALRHEVTPPWLQPSLLGYYGDPSPTYSRYCCTMYYGLWIDTSRTFQVFLPVARTLLLSVLLSVLSLRLTLSTVLFIPTYDFSWCPIITSHLFLSISNYLHIYTTHRNSGNTQFSSYRLLTHSSPHRESSFLCASILA